MVDGRDYDEYDYFTAYLSKVFAQSRPGNSNFLRLWNEEFTN